MKEGGSLGFRRPEPSDQLLGGAGTKTIDREVVWDGLSDSEFSSRNSIFKTFHLEAVERMIDVQILVCKQCQVSV